MMNSNTSLNAWLTLAASAFLFTSYSSQADDDGFYIGGSAGGATLEAGFDQAEFPELPSSIDEDDTAYKLFVGYKLDLPILTVAVEGGYVNLGEPEIPVTGIPGLSEVGIETTALNVWGIAGVEAGPVDLFAKLGFVSWDAEASVGNFGSASDDGTDPAYGVGLSFAIGPLEVRGEYEVYDFDGTDIDMLSVGLAYFF
ncbi:MAG: outer membrane beta-barrel protein [Pseudomonadota bacterium]